MPSRYLAPIALAVGLSSGLRGSPVPPPVRPDWTPRNPGRSARDQIANARARVQAARERARQRMHNRRRKAPGDFQTVNIGVLGAVAAFVVVVVALVLFLFNLRGVVVPMQAPSSAGGGAWPAQ